MAEALRREAAGEGLVERAVEVEFGEGSGVVAKVFAWDGDARGLPAEEDVEGVGLVSAVEGMG